MIHGHLKYTQFSTTLTDTTRSYRPRFSVIHIDRLLQIGSAGSESQPTPATQPVFGWTLRTELANAMPIYDAILVLATDEERAAILAAGPRWELYHNSAFGEAAYQAAREAYVVIKRVLTRVVENPELRFTGTNRRMQLPRGPLDGEDVVGGRLLWLGPDGRNSELFLDWTSPITRLDNLHIEPIELIRGGSPRRRLVGRPPMSPPHQEAVAPKRPSEAAVREWMERIASTAVAAGRKPKRDGTIEECRSALGATHAQALAAWNLLPPEIKRTRGQRGGP